MKPFATVHGGTIHAEIEIAAPPEAVFHALTTPSELMTWWGRPEMYTHDAWELDLRVGGKWKSQGHGADGRVFSVEGEYVELDPPRLLVFTWQASFDSMNTTTVRYDLAPAGSGTRLTLTHSGFGDRTESAQNHTNGWPRIMGWLAAHVTRNRSTR